VFRDLFSIEGSFVLFLFSGWYKPLPELRGFPIDFTIMFDVLTLFAIFVAALSGKILSCSVTAASVAMMVFGAFALLSLIWSSLEPANFDKAQRFLILSLPSFLIAQMIGEGQRRRQRFVRMLACCSCALLAYYIYYRYVLGIELGEGEISGQITRDTYLEYGHNAQIFFVLCLVAGPFLSQMYLYTALPAAGISLYLLLVMGGRGPLLKALIALAMFVGFGWQGQPLSRRIKFWSGLVALAAVGYLLLLPQWEARNSAEPGSLRTLWRIQVQVTGEDTTSMDERTGGRGLALDMWLEEPFFGGGFGEFRVRDPYLKYPHNLLLEILSEMGIVGALLFGAMMLPAVKACMSIARFGSQDWSAVAIGLIFVSDLLAHLSVQGYLADDRIFFAFAGLLTGYYADQVSQTLR
jgi:O-antigen ligase